MSLHSYRTNVIGAHDHTWIKDVVTRDGDKVRLTKEEAKYLEMAGVIEPWTEPKPAVVKKPAKPESSNELGGD